MARDGPPVLPETNLGSSTGTQSSGEDLFVCCLPSAVACVNVIITDKCKLLVFNVPFFFPQKKTCVLGVVR